MAELERQDIQGLTMSGYAHLPCASYLLLRVVDAPAARGWLARLADQVTTSERKQEGFSVNVAFTRHGLAHLGLDATTLDSFSRPFVEGMTTPHRSRILGDAKENDPSRWEWGGGDEEQPVDTLLLLFGEDEGTLDGLLREYKGQFAQSGLAEVRALGAGRQPDHHEHFGFADGMGQPVIEGSPQADTAFPGNLIKAGEVLLGYVNDYGKPAAGPQVAPALDPQRILPGTGELGRNGTYLVFRQLAQDVADFWRFFDEATGDPGGRPDRAASVRLASKCVGRWPGGAPLVLSPDADDPALKQENDFGYYEKDLHGLACPIGSHIRRANPRDSLGPDPKTALASANRHRILRRGRSYGERAADPRVDDGVERGLFFICLNSDIERQFEFVQQTWLNNPVFGGLSGEVDPIVGHLVKGDEIFTEQADPLRRRVHDLRRFVTVKGGAYFFLPGVRALRYVASL